MSRYIDANLIGDRVSNGVVDYEVIKKIPTADVAPVVHGEWVKDEEESKEHIESIYICSACHNFEAWGETEKYNYCPNCGAKMEVTE